MKNVMSYINKERRDITHLVDRQQNNAPRWLSCRPLGILHLFFLLLLTTISLPQNSFAQVAVLDQLISAGKLAVAEDSLRTLPLSDANRQFYSFRIDIERGRPEETLAWYKSLNRAGQRKFEHRILAAHAAIVALDLELASTIMDDLEKVRLRDEESIGQREQLGELLEKAKRMLRNSRSVSVVDTLRGTESEVLDYLRQRTTHLGDISSTAYTTPRGDIRWQVVPDNQSDTSSPSFAIIRQLGDGTWDEANAQIIPVNGLSPEGKLAFPYLMEDGSTLYFSYAGPETIGRADLYVSRYNRDDHTLLVPQQLPMPFNSTSDDHLYLPDESNDLVWLISDRGLEEGKVRLYGIKNSSIHIILDTITDSDRAKSALLLSPTLVPHQLPEPKKLTGDQPSHEKTPYFWIGNQAIRSENDLPIESAKALFRQLLAVVEAQKSDEEKLEELRANLHSQPSLQRDEALRQSILSLEKSISSRYQHLKALRNEVIQASAGREKTNSADTL